MAFNRSFDPGRRVTHARAYAERIERELDRTPVDVVVSADSIASAVVSKERRSSSGWTQPSTTCSTSIRASPP